MSQEGDDDFELERNRFRDGAGSFTYDWMGA
jgi:hypothetical protein